MLFRHFGYRSVTEMVLCFVETVRAPSNSQIINKIFQTEHAPSLQAKLYVMSCGQKSVKKESNRSKRTFCLICCYLSDFSRSDFLISFGASALLSNRSTQPPINCRNVARRVPPGIEYHANKKGGVTTSLILYYVFLNCGKFIFAPALQSRRAHHPPRLMLRKRALSCLPPSAA